jgi:hypothetical protein
MGEEEEDTSSVSKESSKSSISRTKPPRTPKPKPNENSPRGPHRTRPGRRERQRGKDVTENSASTVGPSNLNPSAPDFVPQKEGSSYVAKDQNTPPVASANKNGPRGGRGRNQQQENGNENKIVVPEGTSQTHTQKRPPRTRRHGDASFRGQPKLKESEDLMLRMTDALSKGEYDCSICTDSVGVFLNIC